MKTSTLSLKVSEQFAKDYRSFCETHCLQVGKFTEHMLTEIMEDYHFGSKAQRILAQSSGVAIAHEQLDAVESPLAT